MDPQSLAKNLTLYNPCKFVQYVLLYNGIIIVQKNVSLTVNESKVIFFRFDELFSPRASSLRGDSITDRR
jgi:hypothetical protein